MGRGRKVVCKRVTGRNKKGYGDDDEDDENYVAEEEISSESDAFNEVSFVVSEDNDSSATSFASEEEIPNNELKSRKYSYSRRRRSIISDYEESEEDDYDDDEDFCPNTNENEDCEEDSMVIVDIRDSASRGTTKHDRRKLKNHVSNTKATRRSGKVAVAPAKRKLRRLESCSDDDVVFVMKDRSSAKGRASRRKSSKVSKSTVKSRSTKKKRSSSNSVSYDSDFLVSDDFSSEDQAYMDKCKNKKKINHGRRKEIDSETSDSDFVVSDKEVLNCDLVGLARPRKISRAERKNLRISRKRCIGYDEEFTGKNVKDLEIEKASKLVKHYEPAGKKGKEKEDDDSAKQLCGICLSEEHKGTIQGIMNCCSHYFCFSCIMEWSKVESRCPQCKRRFATITKSSRYNPMLEMRRPVIRVQMRDQVYQPSEEELRILLDPYETVVCMECHQGGDDSLMLLCDICDSSAHTYCVGLGNEVPDGNWYCECCKFSDEGSVNFEVLDNKGASSSHMLNGGMEENGSRNSQSTSLFQSSSQGFDLNETPRSFIQDDGAARASQASTLSGRRAIQRCIRTIFSNNRARRLYVEPSMTDTADLGGMQSVMEVNGEQYLTTERPNSSYRILDQSENKMNFACPCSSFSPCPSSEGGDFRHVEGAKKQVQSVVKTCLKRLSREAPLERSAFKKMARKATHTILAACGIDHSRSAVLSPPVQPPSRCRHDLVDSGPINLVRGCCCSCFNDYVMKCMVKMLVGSCL